MQRDLTKESKINNWIVISDPIINNDRNYYLLRCKCGKEQKFTEGYINRSNFSISCRSCSQKRRRKKTGKYKVGEKFLNLTIIGEPTLYKCNNYYPVKCDCGHKYTTGHSTLSRKDRLPHCRNCFLPEHKKPKKRTMLTKHISLSIFNRLIRGAKLRGIKFDLSASYLDNLYYQQNKKCKMSGIPINISTSVNKKEERDANTASLDRINSNKGYVEGNVQWVHKKINFMKQDLEIEEFINLCKEVSNNYVNFEPSLTSV